jgi:hypothetical protein
LFLEGTDGPTIRSARLASQTRLWCALPMPDTIVAGDHDPPSFRILSRNIKL